MRGNSKKLLLIVLLTALVFVGLAGYGNFREVGQLLADFPPLYLLAALGLAALNYLLRFLRWAYYLRVLGLAVPLQVSGLVFLSGLAMTVTPGKLGELLKSYLLRDRAGVAVSASAPVVLMERLTDLFSVALLGLIGLVLLPRFVSSILAASLILVAVAIYFFTTRHTDRLLRLPLVRRWSQGLQTAREGMRTLSRPAPFLVATVLGFLAWLSEGVALWVVLMGLGADVSLILSLPIYGGSILVGAVTTLPGGLVGTEGAMVALLQQAGAEPSVAAVGTLLVRVATLWFAVAIGVAALGLLHWLRPTRQASPVEAAVESGTGQQLADSLQENGPNG